MLQQRRSLAFRQVRLRCSAGSGAWARLCRIAHARIHGIGKPLRTAACLLLIRIASPSLLSFRNRPDISSEGYTPRPNPLSANKAGDIPTGAFPRPKRRRSSRATISPWRTASLGDPIRELQFGRLSSNSPPNIRRNAAPSWQRSRTSSIACVISSEILAFCNARNSTTEASSENSGSGARPGDVIEVRQSVNSSVETSRCLTQYW